MLELRRPVLSVKATSASLIDGLASMKLASAAP
jgi:hypothetical protein